MQTKKHNTSLSTLYTPSTLLLVAVSAVLLINIWLRLQLDYRAGHMDEYDYLFVAKTLLAGLQWPTHTYIFGSDVSWYLLGWGEAFIGGLTGARVAAATLGVLSLIGAYLFNKELWGCTRTAQLATLLLGVSAGHIFVSRLASYDAVSFAFFSLAMMPLLRSTRSDTITSTAIYLTTGSLLLLGAVLSKYTTAAYLPFIAVIMFILSPARAFVGATIVAAGLVAYMATYWSDLVVLYEVQIRDTHGANTTFADIISRTIGYTGIPLLLTILAIARTRSSNKSNGKILITLLIFSAPLFLYHLHGKNLISLYKHINFSLFFLVSSAAWLLVALYGRYRYSATGLLAPTILVSAITLYTGINFFQLKDMESGYPDLDSFLQYLHTDPVLSDNTILSEDPYLFRYLQFGIQPQDQIKETKWLDNNKDGIREHQDVLDALWDRKFDIVLLTDAIHPDRNIEYRKILSMRGYRQSYTEQYDLSTVMSGNQKGKLTYYKLENSTAGLNN